MRYALSRLSPAAGLLLACFVASCSGEADLTEDFQTKSVRHLGTDQNDVLVGTDADEMFVGLEGIDTIEGFGGDDVLDGGAGGDALLGGDGNDTYLYNLGDHGDIIQDTAGSRDSIRFGKGIDPESLTITERPTLLHVTVGDPANKDQFLIRDWGVLDNFIEEFVFESGTVLYVADIENRIEGNRRPLILQQIQDQVAIANSPFRFEVPRDSYKDPEGGVVQVFARLIDGRLPTDGWLRFDSEARAFYGTPSDDDIAETRIAITLVDSADLTSKTVFGIEVVPGE